MKTTETETIADRMTRLGITGKSDARIDSLTIAHSAGVDDQLFARLAAAKRLKKNSETIVLPSHRYENLSRGRGWARQGRGNSVTWADRVDGGYECSAGRWDIGATDGFSRKDSVAWEVENVLVGDATWTIAN